MLSPRQIEWVAAFIEGEGSFQWSTTKRGSGTVVVNASQRQLWPLEKLQRLCGGSIHKTRAQDISRWNVCGPTAAGLMMTIYGLISPWRQQQILKALVPWKAQKPKRLHNLHCKRDHPMDDANTIITTKGHRVCRACVYKSNLAGRERRLES